LARRHRVVQSGVMDEPTRAAGRAAPRLPAGFALYSALAASIALHALLLNGRNPAAHKPLAAPDISRFRGAITVQLYTPRIGPKLETAAVVAAATAVGAKAPVARRTTPAVPRAPRSATAIEPAPQEAVPSSESAPAPAPTPIPPPTSAPAAPGAAFANLFAPVIMRPLGRSSWGRSAPDRVAPIDANLQREQAALELRQKLASRLHDLALRQSAGGNAVQCTIAVDSQHRIAEVHCTDPADQGAPWSALHGLLVAGNVPAAQAHLCFRVNGATVALAPCQDSLAPPQP
jgi:hypothetical protein